MLPTINGKSFLNCSIEDLKGILDNQDYRESDYLDFKKSFEITEIPKSESDALNKAKAEFRKDVCAFANAQGGFLIYGIKEDGKAVPRDLNGISIFNNNTEFFENTIKNTLQTVSPRIPHIDIRFIACGDDKFVVILYVHHDFFAPYVFLENNQDYRIYKRVGNSVRVVTYEEMKTMFSQSITLEKEIERYRKERINLFYDQEATYHENQFMLMHMIPETFLDSSYNNPIYYFARKGTRFGELFSPFRCDIRLIPTAAGIRFANQEYGTECRLQNNGIAEIYCPLKDYIRITEEAPKGALYTLSLWEDIERFVRAYAGKSSLLVNSVRVFAGLSVVVRAIPKGKRSPTAEQGVAYCSQLFKLEEKLKDLSPEARKAQRQDQIKVLDAMLAWANTRNAAPKSKLGIALNYLKNQWPTLIVYLEDGRIELSNNRAERSIKPFVISRKNFLFANTARGAQSSAVIFSLIETAKHLGARPPASSFPIPV